MTAPASLPVFADLLDAAGRIAAHARATPVLQSRSLDARLGVQLRLKAEHLQRIGAFKFRGACNAVWALDAETAARGVVTHSSGNHGAALALAARGRGSPCHVVVPEGAVRAKLAAIEAYGATLHHCAPTITAREAMCAQVQRQTGATLVHPYANASVIAGQGTAALELVQDVGGLDVLLVCVGGGGLISGCAVAAKHLSPDCRVIGVEPEAGNDVQQSLRRGEIVHIDVPKTIADGAQTQHLGAYTFEIIRREVDDILTVSDAQLVDGMRFFAERMKLVVEPTGCLGLAAARAMKDAIKGKRVGVIISGGNVDIDRFCALLAPEARS